jgi:hypothetical protein
MRGAASLSLKIQIGGPEGRVITVCGRVAWALDQLLQAGDRGATPITHPAPRWSHYVFRLRREGVDVETIDESHGGAFAGSHARYVLRSPVKVLERSGVTAPSPAITSPRPTCGFGGALQQLGRNA